MDFSRHLIESIFLEVVEKATRVRAHGTMLLNGKCPICNEGHRKNSKRFYLYEKGGAFNVRCHNCNYSKSFSNFLKEKYPVKYDNLKFQALDDFRQNKGFTGIKKVVEKEIEKLPSKTIHDYFINYFKMNCIKLDAIQTQKNKEKLRKFALDILLKRNIPIEFCNKCYVCYKDAYKWRIIIPFTNDKGLYYNFQARDIHPTPDAYRKNTKYLFACFKDIQLPDDKVYNKYNVDASKIVYIFEGIFKSLFVNNSIALCNANVVGSRAEEIKRIFSNHIWVLDSPWIDNTGYEATMKLLELGEKCFIMPKEHKDCKDMDELANKLQVNNFSEEYINQYVYVGKLGAMRLKLEKLGA